MNTPKTQLPDEPAVASSDGLGRWEVIRFAIIVSAITSLLWEQATNVHHVAIPASYGIALLMVRIGEWKAP